MEVELICQQADCRFNGYNMVRRKPEFHDTCHLYRATMQKPLVLLESDGEYVCHTFSRTKISESESESESEND